MWLSHRKVYMAELNFYLSQTKKTLKTFLFQKAFCNFMCFLISFLLGFMQFFNDLSSLRNFYSFSVDIVWTLFGRFLHFVYFMQS